MDKKILATGALAAILSVGALGGGAAIASAGSGSSDDVRGGSIKAPEHEYDNDARESMDLKQLAELSISDAEQAALNSQPGEVTKVEIEDEEGYVVYEVELAADNGVEHEMKLDAGNGDILASDTEDDNDSDEYGDRDDRDDLDDEDDDE